MNYLDTKHQFALYVPHLLHTIQQVKPNQQFDLIDPELLHRMSAILRLEKNETLILFDQHIHCTVTLEEIIKKKRVRVQLLEKKENLHVKPAITVLLPLLKRDSLETAIYALGEVGVTVIQLMITQKSQKAWTEKDFARMQKMSIAAAEQAKQFAFPELLSPLCLEQVLGKKSADQKIFFDPTGMLLKNFFTASVLGASSFTIAIGPEGDLTPAEKQQLQQAGFIFCALTPTIVRASQAAALGAGILRSMIR